MIRQTHTPSIVYDRGLTHHLCLSVRSAYRRRQFTLLDLGVDVPVPCKRQGEFVQLVDGLDQESSC